MPDHWKQAYLNEIPRDSFANPGTGHETNEFLNINFSSRFNNTIPRIFVLRFNSLFPFIFSLYKGKTFYGKLISSSVHLKSFIVEENLELTPSVKS